MERPELAEILDVVDEAEGIKTIFVRSGINALPGQFVMLWIPGMDEKPFAISYSDHKNSQLGTTVAAVGPFSNRLCEMSHGDKIGIRGPYGSNYNLHGRLNNIVMVGGGYGSASLALLAEHAIDKGINVKFILGARSRSRLVYVERIRKLIGKDNLIITTDDGSFGLKGFVTAALTQLLQKESIDKVFACGPDKMLKAVTDLCVGKVKGEISMERYMKCGYGLCGHCCVDPIGMRICVEGPVLDFETAAMITELGNYHRVKSSRKEKL